MKLFVTGATGFVGSAVVAELIRAGHEVTGLARSDAGAAKLTAMGAAVRRGELKDVAGLRAAAAAADGVCHLGFIHDFANFADSLETDYAAITAMGEAIRPGGPFVVTSGLAMAPGTGSVRTESDRPHPATPARFRAEGERLALAMVDRGVRTSIVRLPPSVCGPDDRHGFIPMLINVARKTGTAAYVGDGGNLWPSVHQLDAAPLYRLAAESAPAGSILHAIGDEGAPMKAIATAIGAGTNLPVRSLTPEQADAHFGWIAHFAALDMAASSHATRRLLGWSPSHPPLLSQLRDGDYFR